MQHFHQGIIYMVLFRLFTTADEILWTKVSTLCHFLKKYLLFILKMIEIQQKVKFMSLKISKVFHPQKTVVKATIVSASAFSNYVSTCVKSPKEIFFRIFMALNPKWVPRYINDDLMRTLCKQKIKTIFLSTLIALNVKQVPRLNMTWK